MIVRPRLHWLRMLFVWRGSVLPRILPQIAIVTVLAVLVTLFHGKLFHLKVPLTFVPFTLMWRWRCFWVLEIMPVMTVIGKGASFGA